MKVFADLHTHEIVYWHRQQIYLGIGRNVPNKKRDVASNCGNYLQDITFG
jgi:hypothetical protein